MQGGFLLFFFFWSNFAAGIKYKRKESRAIFYFNQFFMRIFLRLIPSFLSSGKWRNGKDCHYRDKSF
jgi:hypothetical protein